jgi:hypothetical protein
MMSVRIAIAVAGFAGLCACVSGDLPREKAAAQWDFNQRTPADPLAAPPASEIEPPAN